MTRHARIPFLFLLLLPLLLRVSACGEDGATPPPAPPATAEILPADPDGIALPGEDGAPALPTVTLLPTPADPADVDGTRLTTRLTAVVAPGATVGEVNAALAAFGCAVNGMAAGSPLLGLKSPARATAAAAVALADSLAATAAFHAVWPARMPGAPAPVPTPTHPPHADALTVLDHLMPARVPGIWSTARAATANATLLLSGPMPDNWDYADLVNLDLVPGYEDLVGDQYPTLQAIAADFVHLTGVAAANWDYGYTEENTGVDPLDDRLAVQVVSTFVLSTSELMIALAAQHPSGRTVVLPTDNYDDPDFTSFPLEQRVYEALHWRCLVRLTIGGTDFVHIVPGGTVSRGFGLSLDSPYTIAGAAHLDAVANGVLEADAAEAFGAHFAGVQAAVPGVGTPPDNLLMVGSSGRDGALSSFSDAEAAVRMVGEDVAGHCGLIAFCGQETSRRVSSNGVAAAQVAGLASYLWHLAPDLSAQDVLLRLQHAYTAAWQPGVLDGWTAAFSTDRSLSPAGAPARLALLDVDSTGTFTEDDLESFVNAFDRLQGNDTYFTRWDLNGDGRTGGDGRAPMDLDVNDLPGFGTVSQDHGGIPASYDERGVTDAEVLCYYAWSSLYTGDESVRDDLLSDCGGDPGNLTLGWINRLAYVDLVVGGSYEFDHRESDQVGVWNATANRSLNNTAGSYAGQTSGTTTMQSAVLSQGDEDFTGLTASGTATVAMNGTWPAPADKRADNWVVRADGSAGIGCSFDVTDGPRAFTLTVDYSASTADDYAEFNFFVALEGDAAGDIVVLETDVAETGHKSWSGVLQPDEYWFDLDYFIMAGDPQGIHNGTLVRQSSGSWAVEFRLDP